MKTLRFFILMLLSLSLLATFANAQTKKKKTVKKKHTKITKPVVVPRKDDFKVIAEGFNSRVDEPFIFVARDARTYAQLENLVENLPDASTIDFAKEAVVAAFAGTKNTGGYSVAINKMADKIAVEVVKPSKEMMVTQALTTPFKIAVEPVEEEMTLPLEISADWTSAMQTYKVSSGEFEYSGGFAFRQKKFAPAGTIAVLSFGDLVTMDFNLTAKNDQKMMLTETASGALKDAKVDLARLDAGSFSEGPKPPLKVSGTMSNDKLILTFEPLPTTVADGFSASGKLEAVKIK